MIELHTAVGLIPSFWGIRRREDIAKNLEHLESLTKAAFWLSSLDIPVRLIAIPEGALQGFNDEVMDVDHAEDARTCAIDSPGPETEGLGALAKQYDVFIMAEAKARHPDWPDLFFNIGFVIDPSGAVILQHYKLSALLPYERSVSPHDLYDWWVERYGRDGDGGQLSRKRARAGDERGQGRVSRITAWTNGAGRLLRDFKPRPRVGKQHVR